MSNRQVYPSSLFPLQGDLAAMAGATSVTVVGLQTVPISTDTPSDQEVLTFIAATGEWTPEPNGFIFTNLIDCNVDVGVPMGFWPGIITSIDCAANSSLGITLDCEV